MYDIDGNVTTNTFKSIKSVFTIYVGKSLN